MLTGNYNRAAPSAANYMRPALYHVSAPAKALGCKPGKSLAAMLTGKPPRARAAWLAANYARHVARQPLLWPNASA